MKKHFSFFFMLCLTCWISACNNSGSNKDSVEKADSANEKKADSSTKVMKVDEETSDFMVKAADGGMMEVELGKVAREKAKNQRVKEFGEMMVVDHSKANEELKSLAAQKNVTIPAAVGEDHRKHIDDLSKKSGADFDKAYMKMMVDDHKEDIDLFEKDSSSGKDPDVKAWAAKTLPVLRKHLAAAKSINSKL
jgi:putative membrane protein